MGLGSAPTVSLGKYDQGMILTQYLINNGIDNLWAKQANSDTPAIVSFTIQDADLGVIQNVTFSSPRIVMQQSQIVFQFRIESGTFMAKNQTPSSIDLSGFRLAYPASLSNSTLDTTTALYKQMQSKMAVPGNYSINQLLINLPVSTDSTFWANPLPSLTSFGANSGNVTPAIMKILGVLLAVKFAGLKSLGLLASGYSAQVANPASITDHPPTFVPTYAHMQSYPWIAQSPLSQPSFGLQGNARLNSLCFMEMTQGRVAPTGSDVDVPFNGNWTTSIPPTLATYRVLPTNTFTVAASSAQSCNEPTKALDSSNMTFWHTQYSPTLTQYPHSITIDMHTTQLVNGLTYLPRQDTTPNGRIAKYSIQLSINGLSWGPDVAVGTFANDTSLKQVFFSSSYARVVRLTALSEVSGNAWASAAEINILSGALNKSDWQVSADSAESGFSASNASDQSMDTIWHTSYSGNPAYPHTFTIDLYQMASKVGWKPISGLVYTPRQDITRNGTIGKFSIRVSGDMTKWTTLASDRWVDDRSSKVVRWAPTPGRYFQLQAISEAGNRGPWASAAAIDLLDGSGQIADSTSTDFGYFGLSRASFFDRYLIPKLRVLNAGLEAFIAGLTVDMSDWSAPLWQANQPCIGMNNNHTYPKDDPYFDFKPTSDPHTWTFNSSCSFHGESSHPNMSTTDTYMWGDASCSTSNTLTYAPGWSTIYITGSTNMHFYASVKRGYTQDDTIDHTLNWQMTLTLQSVRDGGLQIAMTTPSLTSSPPTASIVLGSSGKAKESNPHKNFGSTNLASWVDSAFAAALTRFSSLEAALAADLAGPEKFYFPAAGRFFFKNPTFSENGDVWSSVGYNGVEDGTGDVNWAAPARSRVTVTLGTPMPAAPGAVKISK